MGLGAGLGVISVLGYLVRLALKKDCFHPVGSVCRGVAKGEPAAEDLGDASLREPEDG